MSELQLRHGNQDQAAEVYEVAGIGNEAHAVHLLTVRSPQEALELFRLLDSELGICATCDQPMWLSTAGWCADGDRPYCCSHPKCSALECPGERAVSGL